jgi:hypothetical protein
MRKAPIGSNLCMASDTSSGFYFDVSVFCSEAKDRLSLSWIPVYGGSSGTGREARSEVYLSESVK